MVEEFLHAEYTLALFKQEKGFHRLLSGMSAEYARHGRTYGAVRLANPTSAEENAISAFFERDYFDQAMIRISLADFQRQLVKVSPYVPFSTLMAAFAPGDVEDKRSLVHKNKDAFTGAVAATLLPMYQNAQGAQAWLNEVTVNMRRAYKPWIEAFAATPQKVLADLGTVAQTLSSLPQNPAVPLSAFEAACGLPPGALAFDGEYGALFIRALAHMFGANLPGGMEASIGLYLQAGLITGSPLCQVAVQNLTAVNQDGAPDKICAIYNRRKQAHVLTLENVVQFSQAGGAGGRVFIVESPLVYAALRERLPDTHCTLISPMGNVNPAFVQLLTLLHQAGDTLYYAGNMDYKGLAQADALHARFGKQFIPWRYTRQDYERILAQNATSLSGERNDLTMGSDALALILSELRKTGKTASSMPLVPLFTEDIKTLGGVQQ